MLAANSPPFETVVLRPRLIWGADDTSLLPQFEAAMKNGQFMWFNGGHYLTSTCHIANVCEGLILGAEKGRGGEVYFLTDGQPVEFRTFLTAMVNTRKVDPGKRSIPYEVAWGLAVGAEWVWRTFGLKGEPLLTRTTVKLMGEEVTVNDAKARRELGYQGKMTIAQGLAEMKG